jgi:hypothetical protein
LTNWLFDPVVCRLPVRKGPQLLRRRQRPDLIEMRALTPYDATSAAFKMLNSDQFSGTQSLILGIQTKDHTEGELD